jgi:hypothetical protein
MQGDENDREDANRPAAQNISERNCDALPSRPGAILTIPVSVEGRGLPPDGRVSPSGSWGARTVGVCGVVIV